jgi:hypothetical protein
VEPERLWPQPIAQDERRSDAVPTREMAQDYLNRLYQDLEQRAAQHTDLIVPQARQ